MSITPLDPANFNPNLKGITRYGAFRFWCQQVLPLTFDDSLSYYELLNKLVDYLNKTMENVNDLGTDVESLGAAYEQLENYVNTYFSSLDVQTEINNKLDEMASDTSEHGLSALLAPFIPDLVTDWLQANVTPVGSAVVVNPELNISGAAADAKVTGDKFTSLESSLKSPEYWSGSQLEYGYINNSGTLQNDPNGNRQRTDYIPITPNVELSYIGENNHASINGISFYDKYGNYISGDSNSGVLGEYSTVTTPSNAYFARISTIKNIKWKAEIKRASNTRSSSYTTLRRLSSVEDDTDIIKDNIDNLRNTVYDKENIVDFVGINGKTTQSGLTITQDYNYITINGVYTSSARRRFNMSGELENTADAVPQSWCTNVIGKLKKGKLYRFTVKNTEGNFLADESVVQVLNMQCFDTNGVSLGANMYLYVDGSFSTITIKPTNDIDLGCVALTINKDVTFNNYKIFVVFTEITENQIAFVDRTYGSDLGVGSKTEPYKTINKALTNGATTIFIKPNVYNEKINISGGELNIMPWVDNQSYSLENPFRPKIIITNGTQLTISQDSGNIYKANYIAETDSNIYKVFVTRELDPVTQGNYSLEYNAMLIGNKPSSGTKGSYKQRLYMAVLTEEELSSQGTFWYDGSGQIKFHPWDDIVDDFYIIPYDNADIGLYLENMESVHIEDLRIIGFYENCAYIKRSDNVSILCSEFGLCGKGMGLQLDNTNARVSDCHAFGCSVDGFNLHEYGYSEFYGCTSFYNGDDGISHHQGCTGIIDGGEWAYNGSGGITPSFGCQIETKNTYCHNNNVGLQYLGRSGHRRNVRCSGNLLIDNTQSDLYSNYYDLVAYNNAYKIKEVGQYGTITEYNNIVLP